jgi:uridine kinase
MKLVSTPRIEFLRALSTEILHNYGRGRSIVAVDGVPGSGRSDFADDLAEVFEEREHPVFRASMTYFQRSREEQDRFGEPSAERTYRYGHDYATFRRVLTEPFRMGVTTSFVTQVFDPERDTWIEPTWQTAPVDATLIVDGDFLLRRELRDLWAYSIRLDGEAETEADELYLAEVNAEALANALVDNSDPERPRRLFRDSC